MVMTETIARDNVHVLLGHNIGVSEAAGGDNSLFMAFAQPPMPILCLLGSSEMPTMEEILFLRAYQEFKVADFGFKSHSIKRNSGIPLVPGANTEVWCKKDGKWQYRNSGWTIGPFMVPIDGCDSIEELANFIDRTLWNEMFCQDMAIIFPAMVELNKCWDLEFKADRDGGMRIWIEQRTLIHVLNHQIVVFDDATKDRREFDIADPNCYDDIVTFVRSLRE